MIRHVSSTNTSLISIDIIKHTLFFTVSAHILARVNTKLTRTWSKHKLSTSACCSWGVLSPFLGVSFLLPPFYTCITWSTGLFHKSNFHFEFLPGSSYSQTKSTGGAESLGKHKGKADPCHSRSLAEASDCSDSIATNTDQQCNLKATKVKNKIKTKQNSQDCKCLLLLQQHTLSFCLESLLCFDQS